MQTQPREFTPHDAIGHLVAANGNPKLAAVAAARSFENASPPITEASLLALIASEPTALASLGQQITLLAYLQALDAFRVTHLAYMQKLANLGPKETAKAYTDLLDSLARLRTVAPQQLPDPFETVMRRLPPEVAEAVEFFMKKPDAPNGQPMLEVSPAQAQHEVPSAANHAADPSNPTAGATPNTPVLEAAS